jgi:hypothetical protein
VRLVAVRGEGELAEGGEPEIPKQLEAWSEALTQLGMARYESISRHVKRGAPGKLLEFALPLGHRAQIVVTELEAKKELQVRLEIHRPTGKEGAAAWAKVLSSEVKVVDGTLYAVRCEEMLEGAHLLLLVTASGDRLE